MNLDGHIPLIVTYRGGELETVRYGAAAVADAAGSVRFAAGDPEQRVFLRSGAKPFQTLPLVESGAADRFGFTDREIAVMVGSHAGQRVHRETVAAILEKTGVPVERLQCGIHPPFHRESARRLVREGRAPEVLMNNCSGKHAGMLALALHLGEDLDSYTEPDHPVQRLCREAVAAVCGVPEEELVIAPDGCSVPTFALPLARAARAYARLLDPRGFPGPRSAAIRRVAGAMTGHPEMVGGDDRISTGLMRAFPGSLIAKDGAQGFFGVGVRRRGEAIGIAVKISDGDVGDARTAAVLEILKQIDAVDGDAWKATWERWVPDVHTLRGDAAGKVTPVFRLTRPSGRG